MDIRQYCLSVWTIVDPLYFQFTRLKYIEKNGNKTMVRVRLTRYKGKRITLSDGTIINKNDMLLKIHLHNVDLLRKMQGCSDIRKALIIYKSVKESLPFISSYLQSHEYAHKVKGLIGITMLYKGCHKLGFESFTIQNSFYKLFKQTALFPIYLLSSNQALNKEKPDPMYLFMSKDRLFNLYEKV